MLKFMSVCNLRNLVKNKFFRKHRKSIVYRPYYHQLPNKFSNSGVNKTELCHFHKIPSTILKQYFPNLKPHVVNYRDYWQLCNIKIRAQLDYKMLIHDTNNMEYQNFFNWFIESLNKHTIMKQKYLRAIQGKIMTNNLHKTIMKVLVLAINCCAKGNKFLKTNKKKTTKTLFQPFEKAKKDHFANLDVNYMPENKTFWSIGEPPF